MCDLLFGEELQKMRPQLNNFPNQGSQTIHQITTPEMDSLTLGAYKLGAKTLMD